MKVSFIKPYLSITDFDTVDLQDFSVFTGLNGSGKTHLLKAIKYGHVLLGDISPEEIVYLDNNNFLVHTHGAHKNDIAEAWKNDVEQLIRRIEAFRTMIEKEILTPSDQVVYRYYQQSGFNATTFLGNVQNFEIIERMKKKGDFKRNLGHYQEQMTTEFGFFVQEYLNATGNISHLDFDTLSEKFATIPGRVEEKFAEKHPSLFQFLRTNSNAERILHLDRKNFESPHTFLWEIESEEKEYQFHKTNNLLNRLAVQYWNEDRIYLDEETYERTHGTSPVDLINEVLKAYDCNGYILTNNKYRPILGEDRAKSQIKLSLTNSQGQRTSFELLSSGEKTLVALSFLIFKLRKKRIVPRLFLFDEIDSSLHPTMISKLLSVINDIFVKKQAIKVILATHSPTTVALSPDEAIFVVNNKGPVRIEKQGKTAAIDILTQGFATVNKDEEHLGIEYNIESTVLPILFTEGSTDKILIETAWNKLYPNRKMPFYIQPCFDASFLGNLFRRGYDNQDGIFTNNNSKKMIALFDFDGAGFTQWNNLSRFSNIVENNPFKGLTKMDEKGFAFAMLLPVPHSDIKDQVCSDTGTFEDLSKLTIELLFHGIAGLEKYFIKKSTLGGGQYIEFSGNKRDFAKSLKSLNSDAFKNFKPLFGKLDELLRS